MAANKMHRKNAAGVELWPQCGDFARSHRLGPNSAKTYGNLARGTLCRNRDRFPVRTGPSRIGSLMPVQEMDCVSRNRRCELRPITGPPLRNHGKLWPNAVTGEQLNASSRRDWRFFYGYPEVAEAFRAFFERRNCADSHRLADVRRKRTSPRMICETD
jgi:hypothetical protein